MITVNTTVQLPSTPLHTQYASHCCCIVCAPTCKLSFLRFKFLMRIFVWLELTRADERQRSRVPAYRHQIIVIFVGLFSFTRRCVLDLASAFYPGNNNSTQSFRDITINCSQTTVFLPLRRSSRGPRLNERSSRGLVFVPFGVLISDACVSCFANLVCPNATTTLWTQFTSADYALACTTTGESSSTYLRMRQRKKKLPPKYWVPCQSW